jgi:hypothetical protein
MTSRNEGERAFLLQAEGTSKCIALYANHKAAQAARKRIYRLGAKALGFSVAVQGCEVFLIKIGPLTVTGLP